MIKFDKFNFCLNGVYTRQQKDLISSQFGLFVSYVNNSMILNKIICDKNFRLNLKRSDTIFNFFFSKP